MDAWLPHDKRQAGNLGADQTKGETVASVWGKGQHDEGCDIILTDDITDGGLEKSCDSIKFAEPMSCLLI